MSNANEHHYSAAESAAIAWRELMAATDDKVDYAVQRAWANWRERESYNGRVSAAVGDESLKSPERDTDNG